MQYPTDHEARNVTERSPEREKARLERKVRHEQMQKNDAWLCADAVYRKEITLQKGVQRQLKETCAMQSEELADLRSKLAGQESRISKLTALLMESLQNQVKNVTKERLRQEAMHNQKLQNIRIELGNIQNRVLRNDDNYARARIDGLYGQLDALHDHR